jgi:pyruvate/2-oxoglutarate dehydrogenase complex dihydrolipoamide dehydrogenase (E3) component
MPDEHDRRLLQHVRPPDWIDPEPKPIYDLVVIGGGTAGLVCAAGAAALGARVALAERSRLGGDCLNTGCVPSKSLIRSARVAGAARSGAAVGVPAEARVDFEAVMARLRARRADIAPHDSAERFRVLGVDVFFGHATFTGPRTVRVADSNASNASNVSNVSNDLAFRKAVIATGSRPTVPPIPGLADTAFLTSETLFDLTRQPVHLGILGGGPIGCEMAQAFARLGTLVTLFEAGPQLLPQEDADAAAIVTAALADDGVDVRLATRVARVSGAGAGVLIEYDGGRAQCDALLVAAGRTANTTGLGLEVAGVAHDGDGVRVDARLRTTNHRVFAAGDVASRHKFTHAADALARIVIQNALFFGRKRADRLIIPWCTFTDPEVAHVGVNAAQAVAQQAATVTVPLDEVDRAIVDDETAGFVRIHHRGGRIVGATIVGAGAGEMIGTIAYGMRKGGTLADLASTVFPYPTLSLAFRQAGDIYRRGGLSPRVRALLTSYFSLRR